MTALFLAFLSAFVYYYNYFTVEYYKTRLEMTQIEAELQRRNDLIPNLVKAVNDYMAFENKIFQHAADARSALDSLKSIPNSFDASYVVMYTVQTRCNDNGVCYYSLLRRPDD